MWGFLFVFFIQDESFKTLIEALQLNIVPIDHIMIIMTH